MRGLGGCRRLEGPAESHEVLFLGPRDPMREGLDLRRNSRDSGDAANRGNERRLSLEQLARDHPRAQVVQSGVPKRIASCLGRRPLDGQERSDLGGSLAVTVIASATAA